MKKLLFLSVILLITAGCTNIQKLDYKENINNTIKVNKNNKIYNHNGTGYKYYLPKYMNIKNALNNNEKINSNDNTYYLYVDIISYYNKKSLKNDKKCQVNYDFKNDNIDGYLCIQEANNKYLVEIVYNYAKIEVKVDKYYLNEAINNSIIILSTIKYDDELISNIIVENKIGNKEETLNIFGEKKSKQDFIEVIEEYDNYDESDNIPDYDVIN